MATAVRARTAAAGPRSAPMHPVTLARATAFADHEESVTGEAATLATSYNVPASTKLPTPAFSVITAASRATVGVTGLARPMRTTQSRVCLIRALSPCRGFGHRQAALHRAP